MKKIVLVSLTLSLLIEAGCTGGKKTLDREMAKSMNCSSIWKYSDLKSKFQIKILRFNPLFSYDLLTVPNLVIGSTLNGKYVAVTDKDYSGEISVGDTIWVIPTIWTDTDKKLLKPSVSISKKKQQNDLYCKIDTVFYGQIIIPDSVSK